MPRTQLSTEGMTMHEFPTLEAMRRLAQPQGEHECLSVSMPTVRAGPEVEQNRIRFSNMMDQADEALASLVDRTFRRSIIDRLRRLESNSDFWRHQGEGLAVLASPESIDLYPMLRAPAESIVIGRHFHLLPLLPDMLSEETFYLIVVSQAEVHLFRCTNHTFHEIELAQLPEGRKAIDQFIEMEDQIQARTIERANVAGTGPELLRHGHGASNREADARVFEYFNLIEKAIQRLVRHDQTPIVYAGDHHLFPIFKQAVTSLNVIDEHLSGNFDSIHTNYRTVHERAWPLVEPHLRQRRQWVLDSAKRAFNSDRISTDVATILRYAHQGRIEELVIADPEPMWGTIDPESGEITRHGKRISDSEDLVNIAVLYALRDEVNLYFARREDMPEHQPILAVFYD